MQHRTRNLNVVSVVTAHQYRHILFALLLRFRPVVLLLMLSTTEVCPATAASYSYSHFVGPVSGPEQRIYVHDALSGGSRLDFVGRPEYKFAYGVEDARALVLHNRQEMRDGDIVEGAYSVLDPDGNFRVVKYTADDANGFQAEVVTNGVPILHGYANDGMSLPPGQHQNTVQHSSQAIESIKPVNQYRVEETANEQPAEGSVPDALDRPTYDEEQDADESSSEEGYEDASSIELLSEEQTSTEDY